MVKTCLGRFTIRFWLDSKTSTLTDAKASVNEFQAAHMEEHFEEVDEVSSVIQNHFANSSMVISAFEVVDENGDGCVEYFNW